LTSNTQHCPGGRGVNLNCIWIYHESQSVNVLTRVVWFLTVKQNQLKKSLVCINTSHTNITLRRHWKFISVRKKTRQTEALVVQWWWGARHKTNYQLTVYVVHVSNCKYEKKTIRINKQFFIIVKGRLKGEFLYS